MEAAMSRRRIQPRISTKSLCLGLLLTLLTAYIVYQELFAPFSNLHLATEYLLGRATAFWMGAYITERDVCDPTRMPRFARLPAECYDERHNQINIAMFSAFAHLTSFYCRKVSPTPYTCLARIGFREMVRYACQGHKTLERIILTSTRPFLYIFVLGRYL